jgi:hypothetical protein
MYWSHHSRLLREKGSLTPLITAAKTGLRRKRDEATEGSRKLRNEELHNLYSSANINKMIESWRMRWTWHVERMGEELTAYKVLVQKT